LFVLKEKISEMKRLLLFLLFPIILCISSPSIKAQSADTQKEVAKSGKKKKNKRELREKKRKEKEVKKSEEAKRKKHLSIQTKDVQKRMNRNLKQTQAARDGKKKFFLFR
jgi:exopolysaccharide biosynthesis protein